MQVNTTVVSSICLEFQTLRIFTKFGLDISFAYIIDCAKCCWTWFREVNFVEAGEGQIWAFFTDLRYQRTLT